MSRRQKADYADIRVISSDHPDLHVFQNQVKQDVIFTNFAYDKENQLSAQDLAQDITGDYQLFLLSDHLYDTDQHEYRCAAFIDYHNKEIVFATAGTRPWAPEKFIHDFLDDVMLALDKQPFKTSRAAVLNDIILDSLGEAAQDFSFHYTGHSLGAALAEISAADMDIKMQQRDVRNKQKNKQISAVTFETPGTLRILKNMYKEAGMNGEENIKDLNIKEFNNRSNIINASAAQAGQVYEIIPSDQEERIITPIQRLASYLAKYAIENSRTILGRLIGKALLMIAPGGLSFDLRKEHDLHRFDDVFVQQKGIVREKDGPVITIDEALTGIQPLQYDETVYNSLKALQAKNNNVGKPEYSMTHPGMPIDHNIGTENSNSNPSDRQIVGADPNTKEYKKIVFSSIELSSVMRQRQNSINSLGEDLNLARSRNSHKDIMIAKAKEQGRSESERELPRLATHREAFAKARGNHL